MSCTLVLDPLGRVHSCGELLGGGGVPDAEAVADLQFPDHSHRGCTAGRSGMVRKRAQWELPQAFDLVMCSPTVTGQLLPPAPSPRGQRWHELQQHTLAAACGSPTERLPPAAGICTLLSLTCHSSAYLQPATPPSAQVLRLLNLIWLPKPCGRGAPQGPGFPSLEELCLAGSTCSFVSNEVLGRLLHGSPKLRLLDLRGCARITPTGLCHLPCQGRLALLGGWGGGGGHSACPARSHPVLSPQSWSSSTWACMACLMGWL